MKNQSRFLINRHTLSLILAVALSTVTSVASSQPTYKVEIDLREVDTTARSARCVYRMEVAIPNANVPVVVPLPFGAGARDVMAVPDPTGDRRVIISGPVLPSQSFGAVLIVLESAPRVVNLEFTKAEFGLTADPSRPGAAGVEIFLRQAHAQVQPLFPGTSIATLAEVRLDGDDFADARPPLLPATAFVSWRAVNLGEPTAPSDILLYVATTSGGRYLLLFLLAPMGLVAGFLSAQRIAAKGWKAIMIAASTFVALVILVALYFTAMPVQQRLSDTGVIMGAATVAGLLLGTAIYAFIHRNDP